MTNVLTTISGIITVLVPVLNLVYKLINGQPINAEDVALLGVGSAAGHGLYQARDARTPETIVSKTTELKTQ